MNLMEGLVVVLAVDFSNFKAEYTNIDTRRE